MKNYYIDIDKVIIEYEVFAPYKTKWKFWKKIKTNFVFLFWKFVYFIWFLVYF